jgi:hypothetical protein
MISKVAVIVGATLAATTVYAQEGFTPLAEKRFEYTALVSSMQLQVVSMR